MTVQTYATRWLPVWWVRVVSGGRTMELPDIMTPGQLNRLVTLRAIGEDPDISKARLVMATQPSLDENFCNAHQPGAGGDLARSISTPAVLDGVRNMLDRTPQ